MAGGKKGGIIKRRGIVLERGKSLNKIRLVSFRRR